MGNSLSALDLHINTAKPVISYYISKIYITKKNILSRPRSAPTRAYRPVGADLGRDKRSLHTAFSLLSQPNSIPQRILPYFLHNARPERIGHNVPCCILNIFFFSQCMIMKSRLPNTTFSPQMSIKFQ